MNPERLNDTIKYYEKEYKTLISETIDADTEVLRKRFLSHIPDNGEILDLGCGSGRDGSGVWSRDPAQKRAL